jgi:peptidoglycan/xylan/chitin deacetylase (PgdA/CDA1 family)
LIKRLVKLIIAIVFHGFKKIMALFRESPMPGTCVVLMYHGVTPAQSKPFVRQMEKLLKLTTPVATDAIRDLEDGKRYAAVTFDDGFASTIDTVMPVLNQKAIPATFFIPTAYLGKEATWISDDQKRMRVGHVLTAAQLKKLSEYGLAAIGSHGINHLRLTEMNDAEANKEIAVSKKIIEDITGKEALTHSFPFGSYDKRHVTMARKAGYSRVFTIDPKVSFGTQEEFVTGRVEVDPGDWSLEFTLKLIGSYRWHPYAVALKKRLFNMLP